MKRGKTNRKNTLKKERNIYKIQCKEEKKKHEQKEEEEKNEINYNRGGSMEIYKQTEREKKKQMRK